MSRPGDPRTGHRFRTTAAAVLAESDLCWLCGHGGARTVDHIIPVKDWLARFGNYEGVNQRSNLAPAHGQRGRQSNRCPTCARLCNQARRSHPQQPRSRQW
jgi:5-methylcytosine-specific restriction endonuclease McrA